MRYSDCGVRLPVLRYCGLACFMVLPFCRSGWTSILEANNRIRMACESIE